MTLEEAIQQLVNLGEKDPLTIARKIVATNDGDWLAHELTALAEDIITERARQRLGAFRRSAELALQPGSSQKSELRLAKFWIPDEGWKKAADLTEADLRARARWYEVFAHASMRRAAWCHEVADLIKAEGVGTLGKLKAELPSIPDEAELMALPVAVGE